LLQLFFWAAFIATIFFSVDHHHFVSLIVTIIIADHRRPPLPEIFPTFFSKQNHHQSVLSYCYQLSPMSTKNSTPLNSNDLQVLQSNYRLDGSNYLQWTQLVRATLKGRKKLNHLEGNHPAQNGPKYEDWDDEDSLIMTWLWNSMTPEISRNCMFCSITKDIWENLCQTYSMKKDTAACYEIEHKIIHTSQRSLLVTNYYGMLNGLWIELDQCQNLRMKCTNDSIALVKFLERVRIFNILYGLNSEFDPIRIQILGKEKLPSLSLRHQMSLHRLCPQ